MSRYILGDHVECRVQCYDADGAPVIPDACPTIDIYDSTFTSVLAAKKIPPQDKNGASGLFYYRQHLSNVFATGRYTILYKWTASAFSGQELSTFEVVAGGDGYGQYISCFYLKRPFADFLLGQTDGGVIDRVKNPRF